MKASEVTKEMECAFYEATEVTSRESIRMLANGIVAALQMLGLVEDLDRRNHALHIELGHCADLLPGPEYMDLPDGGDVDVSEQLRRMIDALKDERDALRKDAERYRTLRRGQHWSVVDGVGNTLRGDELDAALQEAKK